MKTLLEHLKKCHSLLALSKSVSATKLSLESPSNTGVKNIVYKQQTGHTSSVSKKTTNPTTIRPVTDIKPIKSIGTQHLRMGNNQAVGVK